MGKLVFAAIVLALGLGAWTAMRRQPQMFGGGVAVLLPRLVLSLAIGVPLLIVLFSVLRIIPAGEVGVKVLFGQVEPVPLREGLNVVMNPLYDGRPGPAPTRTVTCRSA